MKSFARTFTFVLALFLATPVIAQNLLQPASVSQTVTAYLQAGEFLSAWELAHQVEDAVLRDQLLKQIAQAQLEQDQFAAAQATSARLSDRKAATQLSATLTLQEQLAGGSADFGTLLNMIQQFTSWNDSEDVGAAQPFQSGVLVEPSGVLRQMTWAESRDWKKQQSQARQALLNTEINQSSDFRIVSLTRLNEAIADRLADGLPITESMKNFAGLHQVTHLFIFPEEKEILVAGPAAGWTYNEQGRAIAQQVGQPTLQLDDFVVLLETFSGPNGEFGCSIDPRSESLQAVKAFIDQSQQQGPLNRSQTQKWVRQLEQTLGLQDVTIHGVPQTSRIARVIVEADYRMKLIGIGKLDDGLQIPDYFDLLAQQPQKQSNHLDGLRWWLTLACDQISHNEDRTAFELNGSSVRCLSENELVNAAGERVQTGKADWANRQFAENFTNEYQKLAAQDIVFGDLKNIFDLALIASLLQQGGLLASAGVDLAALTTTAGYNPAVYFAPTEAATIANHRVFSGGQVVVQVAGGVRAPIRELTQDESIVCLSPRMDAVREAAQAPELPAGRWWWDASTE